MQYLWSKISLWYKEKKKFEFNQIETLFFAFWKIDTLVFFNFKEALKFPVSQFILPPGQVAPRGASQPRLPCPPGGKLSRDILPPTLVIFNPGGQAVQAGLSCPPPNTSKNIYILFCYFSVSF